MSAVVLAGGILRLTSGERVRARMIADIADIGSNILTAHKLVDTTRNNTDTRADDPELTVDVEANTTYLVESWLAYEATGTAEMTMRFSGPAGATLVWAANALIQGAGNATSSIDKSRIGSITSATTLGGAGAGTDVDARPFGLLTVGATAGPFTVRWAQRVAEVSDAIMYAGSWLKLTPA